MFFFAHTNDARETHKIYLKKTNKQKKKHSQLIFRFSQYFHGKKRLFSCLIFLFMAKKVLDKNLKNLGDEKRTNINFFYCLIKLHWSYTIMAHSFTFWALFVFFFVFWFQNEKIVVL